MSQQDREGPLEGLRVVDLGHYFAAPMAATLLADQGAHVVRIAKPGAPELPAAQMRLLNRNKQIVPLDLKTTEGRDAARALADRADVVVESYRPGVMSRLGLDYPTLAASNPGMIYLSLPGFASSDSDRVDIQAWEGVVSAATSLYTTGMRQRLNFPPLNVPAPICSAFASMHGAIAVLAALLARDESGSGELIEVPLVNAGISTCTRSFVYNGGALRAESPPRDGLPKFLQSMKLEAEDDRETRQRKLDSFSGLAPPIFTTHQYTTADGRRIQVMPIKPEMARRFFEILGLDARLKAGGFCLESPWEKLDLAGGNNLASSWNMSRENASRLIGWIEEVIGGESADHWQSILGAAGIPIGVVRTRDEWLAIESLETAGLLTRMEDGATSLIVPGPVADVTRPDGSRSSKPPAEPDRLDPEDLPSVFPPRTEAQSTSPGSPDGSRGHTSEKADLLAGLEVLDLCNVVAGPNAAYTLAQFGANVIRVEPPKSFNLPMHHEWTLEVNQGKRSTILDLGTVPGREVFEKLIRRADLVLHNRLDEVAERLGMTPAQIHAINPAAVVSQVSAYGGVHPSSWDRIPGYDPMPNMATGLDVLAGSLDRPRGMTEIFADLMSGLGAGFAGLLGLVQKGRTGYAGDGRSSLARAAHFYQFPYMLSESGQSDWGQGRGPEALGDAWWQRMYETADGWIYVGSAADGKEKLAKSVTGEATSGESALETAFRERDSAGWLETLRSVGIGCHEVLSMDELCESSRVRSVSNEAENERAKGPLEVLCWPEHPSGLPIVLPAPAWVQVGSDHSYRRLSPTPIVGQHTREVLGELGYDEGEIERLYALRVAHDFLPAIGNPASYFHRPQRVKG